MTFIGKSPFILSRQFLLYRNTIDLSLNYLSNLDLFIKHCPLVNTYWYASGQFIFAIILSSRRNPLKKHEGMIIG